MLQTLFYIPDKIAGLPVFGFGWALVFWAIGTVLLMLWLVRRNGWSNDTLGYLPLLLLLAGAIVFLLPNLVEEGRGLPIRGFGVMLLLAVVSGAGLAVRRAEQMGVDPETIFSLAFWIFVVGILGARVFYVIEYPQEFVRSSLRESLFAVLNVPSGGIVIYGALIGGTAAAFAFFYLHRLPALALADLIAPGVMIGASLGRVGCFLNGCCYGGLCESPQLAVHFPSHSPPYARQWELGWLQGLQLREGERGLRVERVFSDSAAAKSGLKAGDEIVRIDGRPVNLTDTRRRFGGEYERYLTRTDEEQASDFVVKTELELSDGGRRALEFRPPARSRGIHPAQLYDAVNLALLCAVLWWYYPLRRRDGEVFAMLLTLYPISRFVLEIIRVDEPSQFGTQLSISQLISAGVLFASIGVWAYVESRRRPPLLPLNPA